MKVHTGISNHRTIIHCKRELAQAVQRVVEEVN
jgi:hypothetical protein